MPATGLAASLNAINTDILQYLPLATQTVAAVEAATKGAVPGTTKLTMSLNIIQALAQSASAAAPGSPNVQAIAGLASLVTGIVQAFNATGVFSHSATTPAVTVPVPAPALVPESEGVDPVPVSAATSNVVPNANPSLLMKIFHPNVSHQQEAAAAALAPAPA